MALNTHSLDLELSSSQYASVGDTAVLSVTGDLTLECWVKPESFDADARVCVAKYNLTSNQRSYSLHIAGTTDKISLAISDDGTNEPTVSGDTALSTGAYAHIAVTYDASAGTCAFYLNGSADGTGSGLGTSIFDSTADFEVGAILTTTTPSGEYDGLIDEVRVWNDIRTAGEISANYQRHINPSSANLVGYWQLNNDYTDETSNGNTLTPVGSPVFSTDVPFVGVADSGFLEIL